MYAPLLAVAINDYVIDVMHIKLRIVPKIFSATIASKALPAQLATVSCCDHLR